MSDTNISGSGTTGDLNTYHFHTNPKSISVHTGMQIELAVWVGVLLVVFLIKRQKTKKSEFWILVLAIAPVLFFCFEAACAILRILISN